MSEQADTPTGLTALVEVLAREYGPWFGGPEMRPTPGALRAAERAAQALVDAGLTVAPDRVEEAARVLAARDYADVNDQYREDARAVLRA